MDKRLIQLLQLIPIVLVAWGAMKYLSSISWILVAIVWAFAAANIAICWMLRYERRLLIPAHVIPGVKQYVNFVGGLVAEQHTDEFEDAELLVHTPEDTEQARSYVKHLVRGHDGIVDQIFEQLQVALNLRRGRVKDRAHQGPLVSLLLVGGDGIGKRYLVRVLASVLFRNAGLLNVEADKLGADPSSSLFGGKSAPGLLTDAIRRQPHQIIFVERMEHLTRDASERLVELLQHGVAVAGDSSRKVSFQHCIFIFTTSRCHDILLKVAEKGIPIDTWRRQAADVLSSEAGVDPGLVTSMSDVLVCTPLDDLAKAEVIASIMGDECAKFNVKLLSVAPEILVGEVTHIDSIFGFARVPARVRHMLRKPLAVAASGGHQEMSLRAIPRT